MAWRSTLVVALLVACGSKGPALPPDACTGLCNQVVAEIPVELNRELDILFLIDNAGSMTEEQISLVAAFPRFLDALSTIEGGLPDLHIGVASSNVGTLPFQTSGCIGDGDDGILQSTARGACTPPTGSFISDVLSPDGTTRVTNYPPDTTLAEVFDCIALLGNAGCGLQQHLESMKRALDGHRPENASFIRPDALLAVILIADQDDCSATDGSIFDPSQMDISEPLGPFGGFRCYEFGMLCDGMHIARAPASYSRCEPMPADQAVYLTHPDVYVEFLRELKGDDRHLFVAGIIGELAPVNVILDFDGEPVMDQSCGRGTPQSAQPAVRMDYLVGQFDHHASSTICNQDLGDALALIAQGIRTLMGSQCLAGEIPDPSTCTVFDATGPSETEIPPCASTGGAPTCFDLIDDPLCADTPTHLSLRVTRAIPPPDGTYVIVRCLVEAV